MVPTRHRKTAFDGVPAPRQAGVRLRRRAVRSSPSFSAPLLRSSHACPSFIALVIGVLLLLVARPVAADTVAGRKRSGIAIFGPALHACDVLTGKGPGLIWCVPKTAGKSDTCEVRRTPVSNQDPGWTMQDPSGQRRGFGSPGAASDRSPSFVTPLLRPLHPACNSAKCGVVQTAQAPHLRARCERSNVPAGDPDRGTPLAVAPIRQWSPGTGSEGRARRG